MRALKPARGRSAAKLAAQAASLLECRPDNSAQALVLVDPPGTAALVWGSAALLARFDRPEVARLLAPLGDPGTIRGVLTAFASLERGDGWWILGWVAPLPVQAESPRQAVREPAPSWVRDVLTGKADIDLGASDRHELDAVLARWYAGQGWKDRLTQEFRPLLTDSDVGLRSAAVLFFARTTASGEGELVDAFLGHLSLYDGVRQDWYPDEPDLRALLASAIASRARDDASAQQVARQEALRPGMGQHVVMAVLMGDPAWLRAHLVDVVEGSPLALPIVLFWLRSRGEDARPWLEDLRGRSDLLEPTVAALRGCVGADDLRAAVEALTDDPEVRRRLLG